jgi:hypothetical protein
MNFVEALLATCSMEEAREDVQFSLSKCRLQHNEGYVGQDIGDRL